MCVSLSKIDAFPRMISEFIKYFEFLVVQRNLRQDKTRQVQYSNLKHFFRSRVHSLKWHYTKFIKFV